MDPWSLAEADQFLRTEVSRPTIPKSFVVLDINPVGRDCTRRGMTGTFVETCLEESKFGSAF